MVLEPDFEIHMDGTDCRPWPPQKKNWHTIWRLIWQFVWDSEFLSIWHTFYHSDIWSDIFANYILYLAFYFWFHLHPWLFIWLSGMGFRCPRELASMAIRAGWPQGSGPSPGSWKNWDDLGPHHFAWKTFWKTWQTHPTQYQTSLNYMITLW